MSESQSFLQRFFDASLIPADTDDDRLGHYQAAAADLAKRFGEKPSDAVSASRVAIDPKCPATDPWFAVVQDAVKLHWKTFLANHHDSPRQICRAILLEALSIAVAEDENLSAAVWNATSNLLPHLGNGAEQTITREFISELGEECEAYSSEIWGSGASQSTKPPELAIKLTPIEETKVSQKGLEKGLAEAAGPSDNQGRGGDRNPTWPQNDPNRWVTEFSSRAAKTIASEVNKAIGAIQPGVTEFTEQLEPALKKQAGAISKWVLGSTQRSERLTFLLWWKQALYSPSLKRSYRGLSATGISIATTFDLSGVSGAPVPVSVEYFLREVIHTLVPDNSRLSLAEMIEATKTSDPIEPCLPTTPSGPPHRISLREFLAFSRHGTPRAEDVPAYLGIERSTTLTVSEWAVWLLRERLADILATTNSRS